MMSVVKRLFKQAPESRQDPEKILEDSSNPSLRTHNIFSNIAKDEALTPNNIDLPDDDVILESFDSKSITIVSGSVTGAGPKTEDTLILFNAVGIYRQARQAQFDGNTLEVFIFGTHILESSTDTKHVIGFAHAQDCEC